MKVLELFAGTSSFSNSAKRGGQRLLRLTLICNLTPTIALTL